MVICVCISDPDSVARDGRMLLTAAYWLPTQRKSADLLVSAVADYYLDDGRASPSRTVVVTALTLTPEPSSGQRWRIQSAHRAVSKYCPLFTVTKAGPSMLLLSAMSEVLVEFKIA